MINVTINSQPLSADIGHINNMADLVEFVKANIDPTSIITDLQLNGKALSDIDWRMPLSVQGNAELAVTTGSQKEFVQERLKTASLYVEHIINELIGDF